MLQIFRGKVCNIADLPGGRSAIQHRHKIGRDVEQLIFNVETTLLMSTFGKQSIFNVVSTSDFNVETTLYFNVETTSYFNVDSF